MKDEGMFVSSGYLAAWRGSHGARGCELRVAPKDEGMSLGGAISALELKGACMEKNWPFDVDKVNQRCLRSQGHLSVTGPQPVLTCLT